VTGQAGRPAGTVAGTRAGSTAGPGPRSTTAPARPAPAQPAPAEPELSPAGGAGEQEGPSSSGRLRRLRRGRRLWLVVASAVVVAALALAVVSLVRAPSDAEVRSSALVAARTYTTSLTTFDARTFEQDAERVRRASTPEFVAQYDETIEGLRETVEDDQVVSTGTVVGAGLEELDGDTATVLVAVNQELVSAQGPARTEANRLRMVLERRNGRWLVADVDRL
jgi:Mce-associated membrane protein